LIAVVIGAGGFRAAPISIKAGAKKLSDAFALISFSLLCFFIIQFAGVCVAFGHRKSTQSRVMKNV
jgi:hypothetical protein